MTLGYLRATIIGGILAASVTAALATPIGTTETFSVSMSNAGNPTNVGVITLKQISATSVQIFADLIPTYGFLNTGGPHTPFAFDLNVSGGLSISSWITPVGGTAPNGSFTLNTSGGQATPYGTFNTSLDYSGGNGSSHDYVGDLNFVLDRTGGLDLTNFISVLGNDNVTHSYFAADITNGGAQTGSQAWGTFTTTPPSTPRDVPVPEPMTVSLFVAGLLGVGAVRRRKVSKA